jgi:hypothetical protein
MPIVDRNCGPLLIPEVAPIVQPGEVTGLTTPMLDCPSPGGNISPAGPLPRRNTGVTVVATPPADVEIDPALVIYNQETRKGKTCIVPGKDGKPVGLFAVEAPEVWFYDHTTVVLPPLETANLGDWEYHTTEVEIDEQFAAVCEEDSLFIDSIVPDYPAICGGLITRHYRSNALIARLRLLYFVGLTAPRTLMVKFAGRRKGCDQRFPEFSEGAMKKNEDFWTQLRGG